MGASREARPSPQGEREEGGGVRDILRRLRSQVCDTPAGVEVDPIFLLIAVVLVVMAVQAVW